MEYLDFGPVKQLVEMAKAYSDLALEYGCSETEVKEAFQALRQNVENTLDQFRRLERNYAPCSDEPDDYQKILERSECGNTIVPVSNLKNKITGALLGRFAGCTLGVPVESWDLYNLENMAKHCNMPYPPEDYWTEVERPWGLQFNREPRAMYSRDQMNGVPMDDDVTYVILALLIMEKYGKDFTTADVGEYWQAYLTEACTAELAALNNLKNGVPAEEAALIDNPYAQWIGALIRADGFGYACAGNPHLAAKMGYTDAYLTHRRNGIYGEMLYAAIVAAAFTVSDPLEAIRIGLKEIPTTCSLYRDMIWALETAPTVTDYLSARKILDERFAGMHFVHTNNNACAIVFALYLGKGDFTKTISIAVGMGLDNDCTAATCGSIIGAIVGPEGIAPHWTRAFHDQVRTYITGAEELRISDVVERFVSLYNQFS